MIDTQVKCDVCKEVRGPSNHWLLSIETQAGLYEDFSRIVGIGIFPWNDTIAERLETKHVCGAVCAHKILDRYLESLRNGEGQ